MTIQEFIDYYSKVYKNFELFSDVRLYSDASYLQGFADGHKGNEILTSIAGNMRDLAYMVSMLRKKAKKEG